MPHVVNTAGREAQILHALAQVRSERTAHSLIASDGISERVLYFAIGGVRVIRGGPRRSASIGETLVETGKLTAIDLIRAAGQAERSGRTVGETCVALELIRPSDLEDAARAEVEEDVLDLFLWNESDIRLDTGQPGPSFYDARFDAVQITCDVGRFVDSVLERVESWRRVLGRLPTAHDVYTTTERRPADRPDDASERFVDLLDGERTVCDAIANSGLRIVPAIELVIASLRTRSVCEVADGTGHAIVRNELLREIEEFENALAVNAEQATVRTRLAHAFEAIGASAEAAREWRTLGDHWLRANELDRALACYGRSLRTEPDDFLTREAIVEIHRTRRDLPRLVSDGGSLAELLVRHRLLHRARNVLLLVVTLVPDDVTIRRRLVVVLTELEERRAVLAHLRDLSELLERGGAPRPELEDVYVRILSIDPEDARVRLRLDELSGATSRRRLLHATLGTTAGLLAALGGWFVYVGTARRNVNQAMAVARAQAATGDLAAARATMEACVDSFPGSGTSDPARLLLQQILRLSARPVGDRPGAATTSAQPVEPAPAEVPTRPVRWTFRGTSAIEAAPLVADGAVYVAARDGCVTAISAADGSARWRTPLGLYDDAAVRPVMTEDGLFVATAAGSAVCLDPATGAVLWRKLLGGPVERQPIALGSDAVIVCSDDGAMAALSSATGDATWRRPPGTSASAPVSATEAEIAYIDAAGRRVFALARTGTVVPRGTPVAAPAFLWALADGDRLEAIDAATQRVVATVRVPDAMAFPPARDGDVVCVVASDGSVYGYRSTGALRLHARIDETPCAAAALTKSRVYVPGTKGRLYALDAATGALVWRFDAKSPLTASPAVADGTVYFTTADGRLIAIAE